MPKNLMPVDAVCGNPLASSQRHGSKLVAQEIRVAPSELEARRVGRHGFAEVSAAYEEPTHPGAPFGVGAERSVSPGVAGLSCLPPFGFSSSGASHCTWCGGQNFWAAVIGIDSTQ